MSNSLLTLPISTIEKALAIRIHIEALQAEVDEILGGKSVKAPAASSEIASGIVKDGRKVKRSAATRARMAAAQKARWAAKKSAV